MRILIIDDEADVCKTITLMLTQLGHTSETAASATEALGKQAEQPFDMVLTDLGMPGVNGLELAQQIRAVAPTMRIVLFTGWSLQLNSEQLNQCGIERVISKPVKLKELLSALAPSPSIDPPNT
jgi:CheY-like chemotaxis protein